MAVNKKTMMTEEFNFMKIIGEAKNYIKKDDPIQASEKLYKCAEEAVKTLSKKLNLPEYIEAKKNGRWTTRLLFSAVNTLSDRLNKNFRRHWDTAYFLHCEGFHERRLTTDDVIRRVGDIGNLVKFVKSKR